jgi:hypothetical protein
MKSTIKKIFAGTLLTGLVAVSGLVTIIFFPEPLFANKLEHAQFKVYSNNSISEDIKIILDNSLALVKRSELYDPTYTYDIFLSYNSFYNKIDDKFLGSAQTARATDNNVIIKVDVDTKRNVAFPTFYQHCEADLTYLIAHEMIHCLQENKYGKLKFNPFRHPEYWKLEGYPEYISRQARLSSKDYDLIKQIDRYIDLESKLTDIWIAVEEGGCKAPKYYYKSRLMTEYLMDIKHFTYEKILTDTASEDMVYSEMVNWKETNKQLKN